MPRTQKRILIVDDEKEIISAIATRLESLGFEVISAFDGQEGLETARDKKPDLIMLDVMLPKMDGYQTCRLLKFDEELCHIPVVMLTARAQEKDKQIAKEAGADGYIVKPFEMKDLVNKINSFLK